MNKKDDQLQYLLEQRKKQEEFALGKINSFLYISNITFDKESSKVSESYLTTGSFELQQIKKLETLKDSCYRKVTLPISDNSSKITKENLELVLFKYYRSYYVNKTIYGQIFSQDNQNWYPRKNFGNKNYLVSTKKTEDIGTIPEIAILRDLHNNQLSILWNYYDYFEDRQIRLYEHLFVNDDF